jgi:hypothetical protein
MDGVESLNLFGYWLLVVLQIGIAGYGVMLAVGRARITSPFTLQPIGLRRSRITGILLVIGELFGLLLVATGIQPSSTLALAPAVLASAVGWIVDALLPAGRPRDAQRS